MSGGANGSAPEESAEAALAFVEEGQTLGLGTGRAAEAFVRALGRRVKDGLRVRAVPTSERTAALAGGLGIPLLTLAEVGRLDVTFDGADEVDPQLDLIKGYGGALVREKIVAASSDRLIVLVGEEKLVKQLGERGKLPIEVIPFGAALVRDRLRDLGCEPELRHTAEGEPYCTDNGNLILDCRVRPIDRPGELDTAITTIPGVVGTGLFIGLASAVVVQRGDEVEVLRR